MQFNLDKNKFNKPIVFLGLPGIGLVGKLAIDTLAKQTKAKKIGEFKADYFPPMVFVDDKGKVNDSHNDIYYFKTRKQEFIFICGDFQPNLDSPESFTLHHLFAKYIGEFIKKINAKEVYSIAGINVGDARITKAPELFFAAN